MGLNRPSEFGELWKHITSTCPQPVSFDEKQRHSLRVRELLMKEWTIVGMPLVVLALSAFSAAQEGDFNSPKEREEAGKLSEKWYDISYPSNREPYIDISWAGRQSQIAISPESPITARGAKAIQTIYHKNISPIFNSWGTHSADFAAMEKSVLYGLFLSDDSILSSLEGEIVVWTSIVCQGLRAPSLWHLRGLRRLGVSREHAEKLVVAVKEIGRWCGREDAAQWISVEDLDENEINAE